MNRMASASVSFRLITDNRELDAVCRRWDAATPVALDTEFIRTNTFYPRAGLFQLADGTNVYLVDPLGITDWDSFIDLLRDRERAVIMHSCSEDLSLLNHFPGCLPARLFDTQRSAAYLGLGLSVSYQSLLLSEFGVTVGKGETRSDWLARPLSPSQLEYAALDVVYLHKLYESLRARLLEKGRLEWMEADCREMLTVAGEADREAGYHEYYRQLSAAWRLDRASLLVLQQLCYWREMTARERNRPRNWILKDHELLSLAPVAAKRELRLADLEQLTELRPPWLERDGMNLIRFLQRPYHPPQPADPAEYSQPLDAQQRQRLRQAQQAVATLGTELQMAPELIARKRQLVELIERTHRREPDPWPASLAGWRRELLAPALAAIIPLSGVA